MAFLPGPTLNSATEVRVGFRFTVTVALNCHIVTDSVACILFFLIRYTSILVLVISAYQSFRDIQCG